MMRNRRLAPMAAWNAVTWGATAVYGVVATALIFRAVGKTDFGVWAVVGAIRAFVLLLDAGLATGISRDVALAEGGDRVASVRVRASARLYAALAAVALIAGVLGAGFPAALLELPAAAADIARTVTLLLAVETALALLAGPLPAILRGSQRFDALALSASAQAGLGVVLLVAMIDAFGLAGAAWATLLARAAVSVVLAIWMRRRALIGRTRAEGDPRPSLASVARFAAPLWIAGLAAYLGLMTDLPIVGALFDADTAADFALGARLPAAAAGLLFAILASAFPQLVRLSGARLEQKVGALLFLACVLAGSGFTFLAFAGESFLQVWVGAAPALSLTVLVIYCAAWACNAPAHVLSSVAMAKGRHQVLAWVVIVEAVVNLAASLALAAAGHAAGPAVATLATIAVSNLIVVPILLLRRLELGARCVVRPSLSGAFVGGCGGLLAAAVGRLSGSPLASIALGVGVLLLFTAITLDLTVRGESTLRRLWIVARRGGVRVWWRHRRQNARERVRLAEERSTAPVVWSKQAPPLVTVRIATYNRGPLVAERALASAAAQTHANLEILVVGDCCDSITAEAVLAFDDPRVRFVNLPERGRYPSDPRLRWMVAGAAPMNHALQIARGEWLAPLDDDDEFTPDHVEVLLDACRTRDLEFVWGKALMEERDGTWSSCGSWPLRQGGIVHASVLYSMRLRCFEHEAQAWRLDEPGDWNLWHRFRDAGVRMGFVDQVVCKHYREQREVTPKVPVWLGAPPALGARLDDLGRDADRGAVAGQVLRDHGAAADD